MLRVMQEAREENKEMISAHKLEGSTDGGAAAGAAAGTLASSRRLHVVWKGAWIAVSAVLCSCVVSGELITRSDWNWATLEPQKSLNAGELAVQSLFLHHMGISSLSQTGKIDMRNGSTLFAPYINVYDGNLAKAIRERVKNRTRDDMVVSVDDIVAQHIDRLQTNSLLRMHWKSKKLDYSLEYKMHSLGCSSLIAWLRWSMAWNADYNTNRCVVQVATAFNTTTEKAFILKRGNGSNLVMFDSNGPVNAQWSCFQSRSLNNMEEVDHLEGEEGIKFSRYSFGGRANQYVDLESFREKIKGLNVDVQEVRFTTKYRAPNTEWPHHGHRSVPSDRDADDKREHPADAVLYANQECEQVFLHDRSRLRRLALDMGLAKAKEALDINRIGHVAMTTIPTVLTAAATSIVGVAATSPTIGSTILKNLTKWNWFTRSGVVTCALVIEWLSQIALSTPLLSILTVETLRFLKTTTTSIIFITATNYGEVNGLYKFSKKEDIDPHHFLNMVQVTRTANYDALIIAAVLEAVVLVLGVCYLITFRRKNVISASMKVGVDCEKCHD